VTRTWTTIGAEVVGVALEDGTALDRQRLEAAIAGLEWRSAGVELPMMPGQMVLATVRQLRIPKVSAVAISSELAPYGLYGVEGNYANGRARIYVVDQGTGAVPVASDFWPTQPAAEGNRQP
jgi:hypothetical protein